MGCPYAIATNRRPQPSHDQHDENHRSQCGGEGEQEPAQLASPLGAIDLAGVLHPTPAVGGEPGDVAARLIPALEGLDRGWYAGAVGFTDATGDGEFCVALRCALLRGRVAHLYSGCGIVRDSDPAAELAESEVKLEALLPMLAG